MNYTGQNKLELFAESTQVLKNKLFAKHSDKAVICTSVRAGG